MIHGPGCRSWRFPDAGFLTRPVDVALPAVSSTPGMPIRDGSAQELRCSLQVMKGSTCPPVPAASSWLTMGSTLTSTNGMSQRKVRHPSFINIHRFQLMCHGVRHAFGDGCDTHPPCRGSPSPSSTLSDMTRTTPMARLTQPATHINHACAAKRVPPCTGMASDGCMLRWRRCPVAQWHVTGTQRCTVSTPASARADSAPAWVNYPSRRPAGAASRLHPGPVA